MTTLQPKLVKNVPEKLVQDFLYISPKYRTAIHLCACGCGNEVVTPLSRDGWGLKFNWNGATLDPSIGNWNFPCKSHYWVLKNNVVWDTESRLKPHSLVIQHNLHVLGWLRAWLLQF